MEKSVNVNSLCNAVKENEPSITNNSEDSIAFVFDKAINESTQTELMVLMSDGSAVTGHKKRKLAEINLIEETTFLSKKLKIAFLTTNLPISNDTIIFPNEIVRIANNFLQLLSANYEGLEDTDSSASESAESSGPQITLTTKIRLENSSWQFFRISTDSLEGLYQAVAEELIEDHSVITLMEYLITQNYDWQRRGSIHESLLHYLITLPDSMLALDKFNTVTQERLLTHYYDNEGNNPFLILTKLYSYTFKPTLCENLKACFDVVSNFDDVSIGLAHEALKAQEIDSAFEIIIDSSYFAFEHNELIIKAYLEIIALLYVHTAADNNQHIIINHFDNFFQKNPAYSLIFYNHVNHHHSLLAELKHQALNNKEQNKYEESFLSRFHYKCDNSNAFFRRMSSDEFNNNEYNKIYVADENIIFPNLTF